MLDFSVFFPKGSQPPQPLLGAGYLVHGGRGTGKSSFAFQAAVNSALAGGHVLVLCQESTMEAKLPRPFVPLSTLPEAALQRIEFLYVEGWTNALLELVGLGSSPVAVPDMVLIDDDGFALTEAGETGARARQRRGAPRPPAHPMAQCVSFLQGMSEWLVGRNQRGFTYIIVTNSTAVVSGGAASGGMGSDFSVALPLAAFPLVRVCMGSGGSVQVTPLPEDRADGVRKSFSIYWDSGLRL